MVKNSGLSDLSRAEAQGPSLIEIITVLGKEKGIVFGLPLVIAIATVIATLFMKPVYTARTVLFPPGQSSNGAVLPEQAGTIAGLAGAAAGVKNQSDMYVAILRGASVRGYLVDKFQLQQRYRRNSRVELLDSLDQVIRIFPEKLSGLIAIEVSDSDPQFAAALANAHVEALQDFMGRLSKSEARERRRFLAREVNRVGEKAFPNVAVKEMILATLIRQFEVAAMEEARDAPIIHQVDVASPPDERSGPNRLRKIVLAIIAGLFLGGLMGLVRHTLKEEGLVDCESLDWSKLRGSWKFVRQR